MPLYVLLALPLIMAPLYRTTFHAALLYDGHPNASGADYAVPAMIVQFGFFLAPFTGFLFFREYIWKTWPRVRATSATPAEIVVGKAVPMVLLGIVQVAVLILFGVGVLGLHLHGEVPAIGAVTIVYVCCAVAIGVALTAVVRTSQQLNALGFLGATVLGAIGGALVPLSTLPAWVHRLSPVTPQYWAMRATRDLVLDGRPAGAVVLPVAMLAVFTSVSIAVAVHRLRFDDRNVGWT
jgi:ABC-2 type transport system permease protein